MALEGHENGFCKKSHLTVRQAIFAWFDVLLLSMNSVDGM